ncbi:IclR family transcriptional regulator [Microtetraspora fusca]|uniref:IclR family transcriptional regulator n=1 Tax=Microtetraspora fusca TaxID=1997 RepID=A0ABW6VAG0_MICFU|nr:IclR family transcriptional regulator [Microtetraspora fusca]
MTIGQQRSVLDRALRILEAFQHGPDRMTLSEISRHTEIPLTTTHRIVNELAEWGALEREPSGKYRVGLRLWEVAAHAPRSVGLQRIAMPFMQGLYENTHRSVHLAVREKDEVVFVERLTSPDRPRERPRVGGRYAMHATAVGLVLLAYAPDDVQEEVISGPLRAFTSRTYSNERELRQVLADIRRNGYAVSDRQIDPEYMSVAAPIHGADNTVVAALSLIVPPTDAHGVRLARLVQATARGISRALGASVGPAAVRPGKP